MSAIFFFNPSLGDCWGALLHAARILAHAANVVAVDNERTKSPSPKRSKGQRDYIIDHEMTSAPGKLLGTAYNDVGTH
jgi:hypothetical protein